MKYFALLALVGAASAAEYYQYPVRSYVALSESEGSSSSSDSASDEEEVALEDFHPGAAYDRVIPARFSADSDDIFMRSMLKKYAMEGAKKKEEGGGPNGVFYMTKAITKAAAKEVLATHKGLKGAALEAYLSAYFDKAWSHFDVNQTGAIAVYRTAEFMRFLASDQYMSLG